MELPRWLSLFQDGCYSLDTMTLSARLVNGFFATIDSLACALHIDLVSIS